MSDFCYHHSLFRHRGAAWTGGHETARDNSTETLIDETVDNGMADGPRDGENSAAGDLLARLLATDADLEQAFERLASGDPGARGAQVQAVVPGEALDPEGRDLSALLASITTEYDEIDQLIGALRESEAAPPEQGSTIDDAVAFVSAEELSDPEALERAVAPLASEQIRLESLFARVRYGLDRLHVYRLSSRSPEHLVALMRQEKNLRTLQSLVEFLRALGLAADTFESLALPRPHIRDYLRHLYTMRDWEEMGRLVRLLEATVANFAWNLEDPRPDGGPS